MGMHAMDELFIKWQHGHLTAEQAITARLALTHHAQASLRLSQKNLLS
jgi:hypothetical protein